MDERPDVLLIECCLIGVVLDGVAKIGKIMPTLCKRFYVFATKWQA
jgi:hypothetical protein